MKTLYGILLSVTLLLLNGCTGVAYEMDRKATVAAPWKVGEVLATTGDKPDRCIVNGRDVACHYERVFLGVNPKGYYWVQEYFATQTVKPHMEVSGSRRIIRTGPYLMDSKDVTVFGSLDNNLAASRKDIDGKSIFYLTGQLQSASLVKNGLKEGEWQRRYENGKKESSDVYKKGEKNGLSSSWYNNGQLKEEGSYKKGKKIGVWKKWSEKGELLEEVNHGGKK